MLPDTQHASANQCSRCWDGRLLRSRRRGIEKLVSLLGFFPFRCDACGQRRLHLAADGHRVKPPGAHGASRREVGSSLASR